MNPNLVFWVAISVVIVVAVSVPMLAGYACDRVRDRLRDRRRHQSSLLYERSRDGDVSHESSGSQDTR